MNIPLKMNRDFEKAMTTLNERYGEDFEYLNGFHETQLNFSDFIDGFIDKNVADVTIDANANASNKDIRSLLNEKGKSHDKLFAFNKIFYEMKKRYNLKTAREWLETEYNGGFYLHDASTSTYLPYCYAYDLTRLAVLEYLTSGVTSIFDMYLTPDTIAEACLDTGMRCVLVSGLNNFSSSPKQVEEEFLKWFLHFHAVRLARSSFLPAFEPDQITIRRFRLYRLHPFPSGAVRHIYILIVLQISAD